MKLLLTSTGISNVSIEGALLNLINKTPKETKVAFIPTAGNFFGGDKGWMIEDMSKLKEMGFEVDIVDISALPEKVLKDRLKDADVLFFEGGSEFHLMTWIKKTGLDKLVSEYLKTKVLVGVSAGSMVLGKKLSVKSNGLYGEDIGEYHDMSGLALVAFDILPHLNAEAFPEMRIENVMGVIDDFERPLYVIDDDTAIIVNDDKIEVISEGKWKKFEK